MVTQTVTVASGATASTGVKTGGLPLLAIVTPAALTSASASIYGSLDGVTYYPLYDNLGAAVDAVVAASRYVAMYWQDLFVPWVRLEMGSAEGAARSITLVFGEA